jgi:hypothetical protein
MKGIEVILLDICWRGSAIKEQLVMLFDYQNKRSLMMTY